LIAATNFFRRVFLDVMDRSREDHGAVVAEGAFPSQPVSLLNPESFGLQTVSGGLKWCTKPHPMLN
jgi:hypothetical protein